ncbi:MAG: hypothetical protein IJM18_08105, partial [Clostridia bacterium]|nr:hypothetical protein [Clostridia bacterium]
MKKYLALILAAAMLISFAACKRDKEPEENASQTSSENVTEQPTEAPTPEPTEEPTPEPTQRPEITEMPDAVSVDELTPVVTIPLVFDTEYDPDRDFACIEKLNVYGDGDAPIHTYGPAAYTVDEDRLIVLDAIGGLIRIYDIDTGEWIKNVDASAAKIDPLSNEGSIAFRDGLYWIYSVEERIIVALDDEGTAVKTVPAPKAGNMAEYEDQDAYIRAWASIVTAELLVTDGELIFKTHGCISYDMPDYKLLDDAFISCEPSVKYNITDYPDWAYI